MTPEQAVVLGAIQGVTEFIPVSSSGHLALAPKLFGFQDQGHAFDVFLNVGTLLALVIYYRNDVLNIFMGFIDCFRLRMSDRCKIFLSIAVASIPTIILFGYVDIVLKVRMDSKMLFIVSTVVFACLLFLCDKFGKSDSKKVSFLHWMVVGVAQLFSIIPGASRLGVCLSAARLMGFSREESYRISMLFSIPPVLGACSLKLWKVFFQGLSLPLKPVLISVGASFLFGIMSIVCVNTWIRTRTFTVFVIYRLIFAGFLFYTTL